VAALRANQAEAQQIIARFSETGNETV
jgi:hypothetical protein